MKKEGHQKWNGGRGIKREGMGHQEGRRHGTSVDVGGGCLAHCLVPDCSSREVLENLDVHCKQ